MGLAPSGRGGGHRSSPVLPRPL